MIANISSPTTIALDLVTLCKYNNELNHILNNNGCITHSSICKASLSLEWEKVCNKFCFCDCHDYAKSPTQHIAIKRQSFRLLLCVITKLLDAITTQQFLDSTPAAVSGLSPASFLHRDNMGKSGLTGGGTMPKMSMSLLRENNNRLVYSLDMSNKIERFFN